MNANKLLIAIVMILFLQPAPIKAQGFSVKTCKMTVKGSSSLHDWESVVETLECKALYKIEDHALVDIIDVTVKIPVRSIKSAKGKIMDSKTHDAFHYEKYPFIMFALSSEKITGRGSVEVKGDLTMAGTTKSVSMALQYQVLPNDDLKITGSKEIKMTDFNMEPPTAMMGTIKVEDKVTVSFDIVFSTAPKTALK